MPRSGPRRALVILLILSASTLLPPTDAQSLPTAPQPEPALCFDRDPTPTVPPSPRSCPGGDPLAPHYAEGSTVIIRLENFRREASPVAPWVRVRCTSGCLDQTPDEPRVYWAQWDGIPLRFPRDFNKMGPDGSHRDAAQDLAPRYNGTWEAVALLGNERIAPTRTFNVWLFTAYRSTNLTVMPGETHEFRASGIENDATVNFRIERRVSTGPVPWVAVPLPTPAPTRATNGFFTYSWIVPKEEALRINECPRDVLHCYRAVVTPSNSAKREEIVYFAAAPADLRMELLAGATGPDPVAVQRTDPILVASLIRYPGGVHAGGQVLRAGDLPAETGKQPFIRVRVERDNRTNEAPKFVTDIKLQFDDSSLQWRGTWEPPRDLELYPQAIYRLKVEETRDRWGNRVPATTIGNYTIASATLDPTLQRIVPVVQRTEEARVAFSIRYHNGTALSADDVAAPFRGCFVRDEGTAAHPCANSTTTEVQEGRFEDGHWVFTKRYRHDHPTMGLHRFVLLGGSDARDRWGNTVNGTVSPTFELVAGSQRIDLTTVMRSRAATALERGESVSVIAIIKYDDGTPYNRTVRPNHLQPEASVLIVNVTKRGADDVIHSVTPIELREQDMERGLWQGTLPLTLSDAETPVGRWSFEVDVRDNLTVPNVNRTVFERTVVPARIRYTPGALSNVRPQTDTTISYSFGLAYPDGRRLTDVLAAPDGIQVHVYRYDAKNGTHVGDPLASLTPQYDAAAGQWRVSYRVAPHLFAPSYVLLVRGYDRSSNPLPDDAYSPEFHPYSPVSDRAVLSPTKPIEVRRGDRVTALFAAEEKDTGVDGLGKPAIGLQRWNDIARRWDTVSTDLRIVTEDPFQHVGELRTTITTPTGKYRFTLAGRDARLRVIESVSANITITPTEVTRVLVSPPPANATKGESVWFTFDHRPGDRYSEFAILESLRRTHLAPPYPTITGDTVNVTWRIPFDAPNGNYTIHLEGRDLHGNLIRVDSPPIEARSAQLAGKVLGNPPRVVDRGKPAVLLFGITYPSGDYYFGRAPPVVLVRNAEGVAGTATVVPKDFTYEATWVPPPETPLVAHWFEVTGEGPSSNTFPPLRSSNFTIAVGTVERPTPTEILVSNERLRPVSWTIPLQQDDKFVSFVVEYFGTGGDFTRVQNGRPVATYPVPHTVNGEDGRYVVNWTTDALTPVGTYRMVMTGEDEHGNALRAVSNSFVLKTSIIVPEWTLQPKIDEFGEGKTVELGFRLRYKNGPFVPSENGRPTVQLLVGRVPVTPQPETEHVDGEWRIRWAAPEALVPGVYVFSITGTDNAGNGITEARSITYTVESTLPESFAKTVPGPAPALVLLGVLAVAALLSRRR